jgi:hypothetical protein
MSALTPVHSILSTNAGVTTLVSTRIYPVEVPQGAALPAVAFNMVDDRDGRHLQGSDDYPVARFLIDCVCETYPAADALGNAVRGALIDYRGTVGEFAIDDIAHDDVDFFDRGETGGAWRRRLGFRARYRTRLIP